MRYLSTTARTWRFIRGATLAASLPLAAAAGSAAAQAVPNRESALEVRKRFVEDLDTLQSKFLALANAFPADKYAWRPAPDVREWNVNVERRALGGSFVRDLKCREHWTRIGLCGRGRRWSGSRRRC